MIPAKNCYLSISSGDREYAHINGKSVLGYSLRTFFKVICQALSKLYQKLVSHKVIRLGATSNRISSSPRWVRIVRSQPL
jgi:hypothetical protein